MSARLTRHFLVDGIKATLTAGIKNGRPMVVLGILTVEHSEIANVAIEYPMKSVQNANRFVVEADDDVIRRGLEKYRNDFDDVARRVNEALLSPYNPHGFTTRGQKSKRPA